MGTQIAYSAKEISELTGIDRVGLLKRASTEEWLYETRKVRGGRSHFFLFDSLPRDIRTAIREAETREASDPEKDKAFLKKRAIQLTPAQLADSVVMAKLTCARTLAEAEGWGEKGAAVRALAARYGKSEITIKRWVKSVETWRVKRPPRVTLGDMQIELPKTKKFDPDALGWGIAFYAGHLRAGMKAAYGEMTVEAAKRGWKVGDYSNFTRAVKKIDPGVWELIRKGPIGFELSHLPKIVRRWLDVPVQTVLCGDQHIFDYTIVAPSFDTVFTPESYLWMDCSSRYWAGVWPELGHYNSYTVGYSLGEAIRYGMPDEIFTDWGKPELSKNTTQIRESLAGLAYTGDWNDYQQKYRNHDVAHRTAQAGKPWHKPIENQMNILERRLADRFVPGYRHRDLDPWVNKQRSKELALAHKQGRLCLIDDFLEIFMEVITDYNLTAAQFKEAGGQRFVPAQLYFDGLKKQNRVVLDDATIDYIRLPRFLRKPRQSIVGVKIRGEYREFYSPVLSGKKERVWVSVDPYDVDAPAVLTDQGGNYVDLAEPWHLQSMTDEPGLIEKRRAQARLMKWWRRQVSEVRGWMQKQFDTPKRPRITMISQSAKTASRAVNAKTARASLRGDKNKSGRVLEHLFNKKQGGSL